MWPRGLWEAGMPTCAPTNIGIDPSGAGCREVPPHMNDRNLREPSRYHEENECASDYDMICRYW